jgi:ankyrin repeat protein
MPLLIHISTHHTVGDPICTRILIERFADKNIRDIDGRTPYEIADNENFVDVMKLLSQFQGGFLGPVQVSRGMMMMIMMMVMVMVIELITIVMIMMLLMMMLISQ